MSAVTLTGSSDRGRLRIMNLYTATDIDDLLELYEEEPAA